MKAKIYHLHVLSALHCGIGQSTGTIDLPIARARATQLPIVPGSSLRGVLRQQLTFTKNTNVCTLFGPKSIVSDQDSFAGALSICDAQLLVLPVRCLAGIVCYVTAPFILNRYKRDLLRAGAETPDIPDKPIETEAIVTTNSDNTIEKRLILEDIDLHTRDGGNVEVDKWAKHVARKIYSGDEESVSDFVKRFALIPDSIMDYLSMYGTEIRTRIAVDPEKGTVREGALWYEENLPAESVMWGVYAISGSNKPKDESSENDLNKAFASDLNGLLQLGGMAGVGRGLTRFLVEGSSS